MSDNADNTRQMACVLQASTRVKHRWRYMFSVFSTLVANA